MAAKNLEGYTLRPISPDDNVSGLSLGDEAFTPLKTFLQKHARKYEACNAARTYVFVADSSPKKIVAYITLVCSSIQFATMPLPDDLDGYSHKDLPAIKIGRLAVDHRIRNNGLGKRLVEWAMAIATSSVMPHVGCRFLVLDAKKQSIAFYKKRGFILLDTPGNLEEENPVMFLDIGKME